MNGVCVVSGHSLSVSLKRRVEGPVHESVLLRDPLSYFLSFYNYRWARHAGGDGEPPAFRTWYAAERRNPISRFLLNRYFEQAVPALYRLSSADRLAWLETRLARFHFVGSYRHADEMIAGVSTSLGISTKVESANVTPVRKLSADDLDAGLRDRILTENAVDQALFDRWKDRKWEGQPMVQPPALPTLDQPRYLLADTVGAIAKKLLR